MIRAALLILCLLATSAAVAAPKIASIRVGDVYRELDKTKEMNADITAKRQALLRDPRLAAYREAFGDLEALQKGLIKVADHDRATRQRLMQKFNLKRQEALTLKREFEEFQRKETKKIDREMVSRMEAILTEIRQKADTLGQKNGYDWVIDVSGKTNTGLPFVLYSKPSDDITNDVLSAMGQTIAETSDEDN
ncbi:OmpH family outer membrane protein [Haloferula rosea]|uniref:OmpH family outer membrane protein n=1 Tax=Haloferula rosea TaxID=490093 RepID=A0A934RHC7_9BACT|nr:OmpH family outer membrane protein [Haloferula rosea]MBK1828546.1 OmpH family outer membrane protein [Haloferula rosea]